MSQQSMFDLDGHRRASRAAIQQVDDNTKEEWRLAARAVIRHLAETRETFSANDFWPLMVDRDGDPWLPHIKCALGGVMLFAINRGWIVQDGMTLNTSVTCHITKIPLWRSRIYISHETKGSG